MKAGNISRAGRDGLLPNTGAAALQSNRAKSSDAAPIQIGRSMIPGSLESRAFANGARWHCSSVSEDGRKTRVSLAPPCVDAGKSSGMSLAILPSALAAAAHAPAAWERPTASICWIFAYMQPRKDSAPPLRPVRVQSVSALQELFSLLHFPLQAAETPMLASEELAWRPLDPPEHHIYICTNVYMDSIRIIQFIGAKLHCLAQRRRGVRKRSRSQIVGKQT